MTQTPTIGRFVHYKLSEADVDRIVRRRSAAEHHYHPSTGVHRVSTGEQIHVGNTPAPGDVYPMLIVRVWNDEYVNGQVFLDGNDVLWVTSVGEGTGKSMYAWPDVPRPAIVDERARAQAREAQATANDAITQAGAAQEAAAAAAAK